MIRVTYWKQEGGVSVSRREEFLRSSQWTMRSFMEESKKRQTLYANCEGAFARRVARINDTDFLDRFISCTLFHKEDCCFTAAEKNLMVKSVRNEMIKISKQCNTSSEVHFSVVWVFYYDYRKAESKAMPLFKVYKTKYSQEAIFFDVFLKSYDGWDYYLDNANLPESFICVPRNGNYLFHPDSESLDLIYVIASQKKHWPVLEKDYLPAIKTFTPFCETVVRPLFSIASSRACSAVVDFIKNLVSSVLGIWENKDNLWASATSIISLVQGALKEECSISVNNILNVGCMLLNNPEFVNLKPTWTLKRKYPVTDEVQNIRELFKASQWNWDAIFCSFAALCKSQAVELLFPSIPSASITLRILRIFLETVTLIKFASQNKEIKDFLPSNIVGDDSSVNTNPPISPFKTGSAYFKRNNVKMVEELVTNLKEAENVSLKKIEEKAYEKAESAQSSGNLSKYSPIPMIVDDDFPGKVYLFPSATLPQVTEGFQGILKNFRYKPRNDIVYDLIDDEGRVQATLFYVNETSAFAYAPSKTPAQRVVSDGCE